MTPLRAVPGNTGARGQRAAVAQSSPSFRPRGSGPRGGDHHTRVPDSVLTEPPRQRPGRGQACRQIIIKQTCTGPAPSGSWSCQQLPPPALAKAAHLPPGTKAVSSGFLPLTTKNTLTAVLKWVDPRTCPWLLTLENRAYRMYLKS